MGLVLLYFVLTIALIVGIFKPALVLRWVENPSRLKVFVFWFLAMFISSALSVFFIENKIDTNQNINIAKKEMESGNYSKAILKLKEIKENDTLYSVAQLLIKQADSLSNLSDEERAKGKEEELRKQKEEELRKQKEQLKKEIISIDKGIGIGEGNSVESLQMDIVLFATWAKLIEQSKKSEDNETKKLSNQLKSKVLKIQIKEFPNLRKKYAKIVANEMWENDIEVYSNSTGGKYINFTGGVFATNKNIKEFQTQVYEILKMFRFKQSRYRWYRGDSEYTYYTIFEGKDSDLVTFND